MKTAQICPCSMNSVRDGRSASGAESSRKGYGLAARRADCIAFRPPLRIIGEVAP